VIHYLHVHPRWLFATIGLGLALFGWAQAAAVNPLVVSA
jgi:hypothetical protein